jgi:hypothetical protein
MLRVINLMLHGIEVPRQVVHGNTLAPVARLHRPSVLKLC